MPTYSELGTLRYLFSPHPYLGCIAFRRDAAAGSRGQACDPWAARWRGPSCSVGYGATPAQPAQATRPGFPASRQVTGNASSSVIGAPSMRCRPQAPAGVRLTPARALATRVPARPPSRATSKRAYCSGRTDPHAWQRNQPRRCITSCSAPLPGLRNITVVTRPRPGKSSSTGTVAGDTPIDRAASTAAARSGTMNDCAR